MANSPMRYVADAARNVTLKPQFIAMKIASVAPTTESAPFIPHAHATICGARAFSRRMPAGMGMPSTIPIGTSVADAMRIRTPREKGIAHVTSGATAGARERKRAEHEQHDKRDGDRNQRQQGT